MQRCSIRINTCLSTFNIPFIQHIVYDSILCYVHSFHITFKVFIFSSNITFILYNFRYLCFTNFYVVSLVDALTSPFIQHIAYDSILCYIHSFQITFKVLIFSSNITFILYNFCYLCFTNFDVVSLVDALMSHKLELFSSFLILRASPAALLHQIKYLLINI